VVFVIFSVFYAQYALFYAVKQGFLSKILAYRFLLCYNEQNIGLWSFAMRIGLVLSGGMAKGAYQIGALRAISEFVPQDEIAYISCASVGVLNGYAYATDQLALAENMWRNVCEDNSRFLISSLLKSSLLQQNIVNLYNPEQELKVPFYASLLDVTHMNLVYKDLSTLEQELIPKSLRASVAMPIYNQAVTLNKVQYYDGAMIDNIPIYPLAKQELDYIICIYFDDVSYRFESASLDKKVIKLSFPSESLLRQSVLFEQASIDKMIQRGYDRAMHILKSVFYEGYDNLEYVLKTIDFMNRTAGPGSLRITGDVLVTNLNKVAKRLTIRRII
jgi:predicted acylesterase/phospholipase RssA